MVPTEKFPERWIEVTKEVKSNFWLSNLQELRADQIKNIEKVTAAGTMSEAWEDLLVMQKEMRLWMEERSRLQQILDSTQFQTCLAKWQER